MTDIPGDADGNECHPQAPPSPLALTRSRRANAGAKMNQLIREEEEKGATADAFYATTYGGFVEEEGDNDYEAKSASEDEVDSDFDVEISEGEEGCDEALGEGNEYSAKPTPKQKLRVEDEDEEEAEKKRKRKALKRKRLSTPGASQNIEQKKVKKSIEVAQEEKLDMRAEVNVSVAEESRLGDGRPVKRSALRTSTRFKSEMAEARRKVERARLSKRKEARSQTMLIKAQNRRRLTQAEILEEAKITEQLNTESLEHFRKFEELKKEAQRVVKQRKVLTHLCIRFSSITDQDPKDGHYYSKNFISFGDTKTFNEAFHDKTKRSMPISRKICPLTGLPAKYFDPVTQLPYANLQAFKMLRQIHADAVKKDASST